MLTADLTTAPSVSLGRVVVLVRDYTTAGATFAHVEDLYGNELILVQLPSAP